VVGGEEEEERRRRREWGRGWGGEDGGEEGEKRREERNLWRREVDKRVVGPSTLNFDGGKVSYTFF
jgi:hypothetical protein